MMENKSIKQYILLTFGWSWILWLPLTLPYFGVFEMTETIEALIMPAVILGAFGPLFASVTITYRKGKMEAVKQFFKKCFRFRVKIEYYILAIVLGLGTTIIAHYVTNLSGLSILPNSFFPDDLGMPFPLLIILYTLMLFFLGGGQEEFGWRGFLQDLMQNKYGVIIASIIIGVIWSLWHLPLWFIEGEGHSYYSFFAFLLYATSWSLTIGIVYNLSGKKMIIPWVMHTIANLSVPLFPVLFMEDVPQPGYWIWGIVNLIVAIGFTIFYLNKNKKEKLSEAII